jgi:hypothetical protein
MWPSGEAEVCKTCNDGSIPSMASKKRASLLKAAYRMNNKFTGKANRAFALRKRQLHPQNSYVEIRPVKYWLRLFRKTRQAVAFFKSCAQVHSGQQTTTFWSLFLLQVCTCHCIAPGL